MRTLTSSLAVPLFLTLSTVAGDFNTGLTAYQKKDYSAAAKEWRPLAEKGDAPSQFNLGLLYVDGLGVPQDYNQALTWFERSAQQDYEKAQLNLGAMYGGGRGVKRDYIQAYKWLNVCAAKGDQKCVAQRDLVAQKLKPKQLATAQRLASEFKPKQEPGKSEPYNPDK
jgi:TPR repeat protein